MKYIRKCIQIRAEDSPNVALYEQQRRAGLKPTYEVVFPGIITALEYEAKRVDWDIQRQTESLDAAWYEGDAVKLIPASWLQAAKDFKRPAPTRPRWMGVDSGEGGDDTAFCVIDQWGVLALESLKTPDTNFVVGKVIELVRQWDVEWENVVFDRGGGGKEHSDRLRAAGFKVRDVGFGKEKHEPKRGMRFFSEKTELVGDKDTYVNRRSHMAYDVRLLLEIRQGPQDDNPHRLPSLEPRFHLPTPLCDELIRQMEVIPLTYDEFGKFKLIAKQNPNDPEDPDTFRALIGRSPDQFDAFCCALHGKNHKPPRMVAGAR